MTTAAKQSALPAEFYERLDRHIECVKNMGYAVSKSDEYYGGWLMVLSDVGVDAVSKYGGERGLIAMIIENGYDGVRNLRIELP